MKRAFFLLLLFASLFVKAQVINKAEYFIDTDPGTGNGVNIPIGSNAATVTFTASVPTTGLSEGFHNLNIRTRLDDGVWGHYENRVFYLSKFALEAANVKAAEYFIDADPGNGNGTVIPVATIGATTSFVASVPTTGLANGFHNLIIRTKNELGQWGLGENRVFYTSSSANAADITAAEFFIDADPGTGSGTSLNIGTSGANINFTAAVPTTGLTNGFHNLFIRAKNSQGLWGHFENRVFYVSNQGLLAADISAMEFFIDTDPGVGNGTAIAVTTGSIVTLIANIPTTGLAQGKHFLFLRAKSADGWGQFDQKEFTIGDAVAPAKPVIASVDNKTTSPILTAVNKPVIKGTSEPNVTIEVFNGTTSLGTVTADATGNWTFTPVTALADGTLNITTKAKNASNLESVASDVFVVTIDTQAPTNTTIVSIDAKTTQNFITANNKPIIVGKAEISSTVELFNGLTKLGEVIANATGDFSFAPTVALADGNYAITVSAKDLAGNVSVKSASFNFSILTLVPAAPVIASVDGKTTQNFTTNVNKPVISGTATASLTVELFSGATSLGTSVASTGSTFSFTPITALADGNYTITAKTKNSANVSSLASNSFSFTIDTQAPSTPLIVSIVNQTNQNFETAVNKPIITGTGEPGTTIEIFNGTTSLGFAVVDASGKFTFTPTTPLADGPVLITAKAKDAAGNTSSSSTGFAFTIDTQAPNAPLIVNVDSKTTQNFITTNNKPVITGTAEPGTTIEVFNGTTSLGFATADATGKYTFTPTTNLPDGAYVLTTNAKDAAGNLSATSANFNFTIDATAPNAPVIASVDGKTISPASGTNNKPILIGTAEAASNITVFANNTIIGTALTNANGNWTFTTATELMIGTINFTITAKDVTGNESAKSNVFVYELVPLNKEVSANNILTPNGDGKNDFLVIENLQYYPKSLIKIYDRAGRTVFTTNNYKNDWSGDLNGTYLAEGTYYYVIDLGSGLKAFKSFITIIRKSIR